MSEPVGYSVSSYGDMIVNKPRMQAYAAALREAVRPGCTVIDIGAGTGIFSLLACQYGAGRVLAIEPNPAIEIARETAAANGFLDRISFYQCLSADVEPSARADVIISDLRGVLPLMQSHIPVIADARKRLLAENGVLIPLQDQLWAALVQDSTLASRYSEPWMSNDYGLDLGAGHTFVVNTWRQVRVKTDQLLAHAQIWATLDYRTIEDPNISGNLVWTIEQSGLTHGIAVWFDAELSERVGFSNAPGKPELVYGQGFFPFNLPVTVDAGDRVEVQLKANLIDEQYIWSWNTKILSRRDGTMKANFRQSSFLGTPISPAALKKRDARFIPPINEDAEIDRFCLSRIDGLNSLERIAREVANHYPDRFPRWQIALGHVATLVDRYTGTTLKL